MSVIQFPMRDRAGIDLIDEAKAVPDEVFVAAEVASGELPDAVAGVRLSDALRREAHPSALLCGVPEWVVTAGYEVVAVRLPRIGEYFYCHVRDRVLRCVEDVETRAFAVLDYVGRP